MIEITNQEQKCYASIKGHCTVLIRTDCNNCHFYKPEGCEDWVRIDKDGRVYILDPDEYETRRVRNEQLQQRKGKFYQIVKHGTAANDEL